MTGYYWWALVILGAVSLLNLGLGFIVIRSGQSAKHRWFLSVAIWSSIWAITNALFPVVGEDIRAQVALISYGAAIFLAMSFLRFCFILTNGRLRPIIAKAYIILGTLIGLASMMPGVLLVSITPNLGIDTNPYSLPIYGTFLGISLVAGLVELARGRREVSVSGRRQIDAVLLGAILAVVVGVLFNLILPMMGNYSFVQAGPAGILLFIGLAAYAIVRYGMFDIRLAVARTTIYVLSLTLLSVVYVLLAYGISTVFLLDQAGAGGAVLRPLNVILALVLVLLFQPIKSFFDRLTSSIFYQGQYNFGSVVEEFGRIVSFNNDIRTLLKEASAHLASSLKADHAYFYINDHGVMGNFSIRKSVIPPVDIEKLDQYVESSTLVGGIVALDSVASRDIKRLLQSHQAQIVLPLVVHRQRIGYMFLGEHKSRGFSSQDIDLLKSIVSELSIAVQNALSIEEVRVLNETLQQRVNEATKELRLSNSQLQKLDEAKDDFISMASHQLRTPLTSIKGYLDMILEGDLGKITTTQKAVLSEAFISSERMVTLINDFLNISRLQTGKFVIERRESDIAAALKEQVQMLGVVAKQHDLKLKVDIDPRLPKVMVDLEKLRQVMLNMVDNAIFYSRPSSTVDVRMSVKSSELVFTVKDTGIGVPADEQPGLFGKFFRASNARKKRPDGTGVGLFLARKVVLAHGGEIIFESKEGKGSTFGFQLPMNRIGLSE